MMTVIRPERAEDPAAFDQMEVSAPATDQRRRFLARRVDVRFAAPRAVFERLADARGLLREADLFFILAEALPGFRVDRLARRAGRSSRATAAWAAASRAIGTRYGLHET